MSTERPDFSVAVKPKSDIPQWVLYKVACPICQGTGGRCVGVTIGADKEQRLKEWEELQKAKCIQCGGKGTIMISLPPPKNDT